MERTVTVVDACSGATADVRIDAAATVGAALPELLQITGAVCAAVSRAGVVLEPRHPVAHLHDGDVLVLGEQSPTPARPAARLEVTAGPDAGRRLALPPGRHVLGRDGDPFASTDPRVSRRHVELVVAGDGSVQVTDLDSGNGTHIAAVPLPRGAPAPWPPGSPLRVGDTRLVHGRADPPAATAPGPAGTTTVNRPPRLRATTAPPTVPFPEPPQEVTTTRLPLLASLAPLLAGVALALLMHRWEFLAFAVMSPLVVLGQALTDRHAARRADRRARSEHRTATAAAERALRLALADEAAERHRDAPDLATLVAAALDRTTVLWHRGNDEDALTVRLGLGTTPAAVRTTADGEVPTLHDVPICIDLVRHRVVGICGDDPATRLACSLVLQAATLCGPADLQVTVLAPGRTAPWAWARWLPHARLALTTTALRSRLAELTRSGDSRRRLIVVDNVAEPTLAATLAELPSTSLLWLGSTESSLPAACDAVVTVASAPRPLARLRTGLETHDDVRPDLLSVDVAEQASRAMASLRDGAQTCALPTLVRWSDLYDLPTDAELTAAAVRRRWNAGPSTAACIGMSRDGPFVVDLQQDGPHVLVAGTTGAGKSELLQTLVASLAAASSPADLNLLLVDFKGGAAFGPCADLPHTVGVLTDLDATTTSRAIDSLTAELRRRERVLAAAGAADVDAWRAQAGRDSAAIGELPRLVIVVDEFATLAEELPDFVGGLVGIAQRGRSLGVHLVLATQRPDGAVSADIRANTRLRICLSVARDAESRDVLDSPRAATISRTTPGRAFVRVGAQDLVEVQTARVAAPIATDQRRDGVVEVLPLFDWDARTAPLVSSTTKTELDLLVQACVLSARRTGTAVATPSWLPPLPETLTLSRLPAAVPAGLHGDDAVGIGLVDLPDQQAQPALTLSGRTAEPLLVVGSPGSGRTTAALTIATALAAALPADQLHIWAIHAGRGLAELGELPHTGAVIDVRDAERVERLLAFLSAEVDRRRAAPTTDATRLLLVVDSWDALVSATSDTDAGRCQELVLRLLANGPGAGLRSVLTSDRSGLTSRLSAAVRQRICLRLCDPTDYALIGLPSRRLPSHLPTGRGVRSGDLAFVQLAAPDDEARSAARAWPAAARPPRRFDPLPDRVPLHTLRVAGRGLIVGLRGDDLAPVIVDRNDAGGAFLVAGPARSGRSTALVSIAAQLRGEPVYALCARRGPLGQRRDLARVVDPGDVDAARAALSAVADGATLLVDDVDLVDDPGVLDGIEAAVRRARDGAGFVVLSGTTEAMAASFRGPVAQARRARSGLLLRPEGPHDGELLGVRLRRRAGHDDPPGRGVLAMHGRVVPVQVPDPA
jgi:S-DNA-T family DNA segregation ATPase FtsK/SpoIIIE